MPVDGSREIRRERRTKLRKRIAERLVESQQNTATLTTFNECDMSKVMSLRSSIKESFSEQNGVGIGFMSFFVKAACFALRTYPGVNAFIDGNEIVYHDYCDVGVAVGTDKGLVVPVLRNAEVMTFADIEMHIKDFALRARDGKLTVGGYDRWDLHRLQWRRLRLDDVDTNPQPSPGGNPGHACDQEACR